jgi:ATP-binding cassette subfamily C protein CydCD
MPALVLACVLPPLTVVAIGSQDLLSAAIVVATLPLVPVFGALVGLATRDRANEQWRAMESLSSHFLDVMRGLPTLVAFRRARAQSRTIGQITDRYRRASLGTLRLAFASSAVLELVATLSVALVAVTVGVRLAAGGLDLRTALVVLLLAPEAYWPLRRVGAEFHAAAEGVATFEKVAELLDGTVTAGDVPLDGSSHTGRDLMVSDLVVLYPGRSTPAVSLLHARIPARGVTVVAGPSGSGKSTLLAVLAGLRAPTGGDVRVGAAPATGREWQCQVAWLPQRPHFVNGTVADNLRLGNPEASDEELWHALRRVALEERVRDLPGQLVAELGEDGKLLSAGERARLALARAVLADRPWLFMDEPTAHLDELTGRIIADTIVELGRDRGVVLVAHDAAMLALGDRHLVLEGPSAPPPAVRHSPAPRTGNGHRVPVLDANAVADPRPATFGLSTLLGALASASGVALTATAGWLIVQASTRPAVLTLMVAIVGVRTFGLARPVLRYAERLRSHDTALRLLARRRVEVYDALVPLVPGRLGKRRGELLTSVVEDVDSVVDRELRVRLPVRSYALVCLLATAATGALLPSSGLVMGVAAGGGALVAFALARTGAARAERASLELRARLSSVVVETLELSTELVMWQRTEAAVADVARASDLLGGAARRAGHWAAAARGWLLVTTGAAIATVAWQAAAAVLAGELSAPMAALVVLTPLGLLDVALPVAEAGSLSARTRAAAQRLDALQQTPPAVHNAPTGQSARGNELTVTVVDAGWGPVTALRGVSLQLIPGTRIGVTGASGSGKSTLAALLLRFLDPVAGRVHLGGIDLHRLELDDVRGTVGLVDDDPHVFASTLVENVRLARPEASDREVDDALRQAALGPWLDALPEGLDTWLGPGHAQVSGGERARIAVARSLLAGQPILVLDEPTAHLDHATADELARELLTGPRSRSVVWITHSPIGLELLDSVLDLDQRLATPSAQAR